MTEPDETPRTADTLSAHIQEQQALGPLMSGAEWSMTRVLVPLRKTLERFSAALMSSSSKTTYACKRPTSARKSLLKRPLIVSVTTLKPARWRA